MTNDTTPPAGPAATPQRRRARAQSGQRLARIPVYYHDTDAMPAKERARHRRLTREADKYRAFEERHGERHPDDWHGLQTDEVVAEINGRGQGGVCVWCGEAPGGGECESRRAARARHTRAAPGGRREARARRKGQPSIAGLMESRATSESPDSDPYGAILFEDDDEASFVQNDKTGPTRRFWVERSLRDECSRRCRAAKMSPAETRFALHLIGACLRTSDRIPVYSRWADLWLDGNSRDGAVRDFLRRFEEVAGAGIVDWTYRHGSENNNVPREDCRPRTLRPMQLDEALRTLHETPTGRTVDLETGLKAPARRPQPTTTREARKVFARVCNGEPPHALGAMIEKNMKAALIAAAAVSLKPPKPKRTGSGRGRVYVPVTRTAEQEATALEHHRNVQIGILNDLSVERRIVYHEAKVGATDRIFAAVGMLASSVREALFAGGVALDLKAFQLCVVVSPRVWDVPGLRARIEQGDVWRYLLDALGVPDDDALWGRCKHIVKHGILYPTVFGCGDSLLCIGFADLADAMGTAPDEVEARFRAIPEIAELFERRDVALNRIRRERSACTASGEWVALEKSPMSVAATVAQSYEMHVLWPFIERMDYWQDGHGDARRFSLVLSLHDGMYLSLRGNTERDWQELQRAIDEVNARARALGIPTVLEAKQL